MSKIVCLQKGFSTTILEDNTNTLDVSIQILNTGEYVDMDSKEVIVSKATLYNIKNEYNRAAALLYDADKLVDTRLATVDLTKFDNRNAPMQANHNLSDAFLTTGHFIGLLEVVEVGDSAYLKGTARIKGAENVEKVRDGRFRNVSLQYNSETYEFIETSWVVKGADPFAKKLQENKKTNESVKMLQPVGINDAIIKLKKRELTVLQKKLEVKKHLIALCKHGVINYGIATKLEVKLSSFDEPKKVLSLLEEFIPKKKFSPKVITDKVLLSKLYDVKVENNVEGEKTVSKNLMEALLKQQSSSNVALGSDNGQIKSAFYDQVNQLAYSDVADKHAELIAQCSEAYENDNKELGKKLSDKAKKLSDDMKAGTAKLSDYEIEDSVKNSEAVDKLSEEVEKKEKEVKDETDKALSAYKEELNIALSKHSLPKDEIIALKEAIINLTNLVGEK